MLNPPPISELMAELRSFHAETGRILADEKRDWSRRPSEEEWSLTEIACHLRDVEREVHQARVRALVAEEGAYLSGVDADEWAGPRGYRAQDGRVALAEFLTDRQETIDILSTLPVEVWNRQGNHTFFGPTSMQEIVYLAVQHDRSHARQNEALDMLPAE